MKRVSATEARKDWFRLLDEVADGEIVVVERNGRWIVLRAEDELDQRDEPPPSYRGLFRARDADRAAEWSWSWDPDRGLESHDR